MVSENIKRLDQLSADIAAGKNPMESDPLVFEYDILLAQILSTVMTCDEFHSMNEKLHDIWKKMSVEEKGRAEISAQIIMFMAKAGMIPDEIGNKKKTVG